MTALGEVESPTGNGRVPESTGATVAGYGRPPGPRSPALAQTLALARDPIGFMRRQQAEHGEVVHVNLFGFGPTVWTTRSEDVKRFYTDNEHLSAGQAARLLAPTLGPQSVLLLDGEDHLRQRKLLLPPFHAKQIAGYETQMDDLARAEIATWPKHAGFQIRPLMQRLTLAIITRVVLGIGSAENAAEARRWISRMLAGRQTIPMMIPPALDRRLGRLSPARRLREAVGQVDRVIYAEIGRRRCAPDPDRQDVLALLLGARDENGRPMTDEQLRDQLMTLLLAGHETTASSLAWAVQELLLHPDMFNRVAQEAGGSEHGYTDMVVKENLRLHPVVIASARIIRRPWQLGRYLLPKGTRVWIPIPLIHRDGERYEQPDTFNPERFAERPPSTYDWLPFGGGIRRCLGATFAQIEMRVVLRRLCRDTRLELQGGPQLERLSSVTLIPGRGTPVKLIGAAR